MDISGLGSGVSIGGRHFRIVLFGLLLCWTIAAPGPCSAQAVLLTAGPHGTYPTIQGALAGVVNGGINDLRIEAGTFVENVVIDTSTVVFSSGEFHISGGWDSTFSAQTANASLTVIDGNGVDRCLFLGLPPTSPNTTISLSNLTLTGGEAVSGGGLYFSASGNLRFEISDCRITANTAANSSGQPYGGGLYASLSGSGNSLTVRDTRIDHNLVWRDAGTGTVRGGGAYVVVTNVSPVIIERVEFGSNQAIAATEIAGAGLWLRVNAGGVAWVNDSRFIYNQAISSATPQVSGTGLSVETWGSGWARLRRNTLYINDSQTGAGSQLQLIAWETSQLRVGDTVVAGGDEGVGAVAFDTATLDLTNLTVVNNVGRGLYFGLNDPTPSASLHNSIVYGNATDLVLQPGAGTIANSHNLVGVEPVFINPTGYNFRLSAGSPAENVGTNTPPAGLGDGDCDGAVRLIDGTVDVGAYEGIDVLFSDGFALSTLRWSEVVGD